MEEVIIKQTANEQQYHYLPWYVFKKWNSSTFFLPYKVLSCWTNAKSQDDYYHGNKTIVILYP